MKMNEKMRKMMLSMAGILVGAWILCTIIVPPSYQYQPIVAIGGITKSDIPQILATGIDGIALSGSVLQADNPAKEMQEIVSIINHFNN